MGRKLSYAIKTRRMIKRKIEKTLRRKLLQGEKGKKRVLLQKQERKT